MVRPAFFGYVGKVAIGWVAGKLGPLGKTRDAVCGQNIARAK